jgi:hypothetical protein
MSRVQEKYYALKGGEHLDVPALNADPGWARFTRNYELDKEGRYRRIDGYERLDGHTKPSEASYWILDFTDGDASMTAADTVTGASSSATGTLLYQVLESGSYAGGDAAGYLVLTDVSGTFSDDENLQVSAVTEAVADGTAVESGADTDTLHTTYLRAAIEAARDSISAVPGSGDILGVWQYNGVYYAFRNNTGGTLAVMYKSTTAGWSACSLGYYLAFTSGGVTEVVAGNTIEGETGGATGTVAKVVLTSGTWAGGDAAGYFILSAQTGTFQSETVKVGANLNLATIASNSTAQTLQPDGRYEFVNYNFGGHASTKKMYWCDGENTAFEWDGSTLVPIITGMTTDKPTHIIVHKNHLFLSFTGGSVQHCSLNNPPSVVAPFIWSVVTGSGEIGLGDEIVGFFKLPGDILCIKTRNSTKLLYGSASSGDDSWVLKTHDPNAGAIEWSGQLVENILMTVDDRGLTTIQTTDVYGDYTSASISKDIDSYLKTMIGDVQCSVSVKEKNQYRVFFDDGAAVFLTMKENSIVGFTRALYDDIPTCMASCENLSGVEEILFGDSSGYVYQADKGTSFDGGAVVGLIRTHYNHLGTPSRKKKVHKLQFEMDAPDETEISTSIEWDYASLDPSPAHDIEIPPSGGIWGDFVWGSFTWGGQDVGTGTVYVGESGTNFGLVIYSSLTYTEPHTLQGVVVHFSMRGLKR